MQLYFRLFLATFLIQFCSYAQFYLGAFGGYNLGTRLNTGIFTEFSLQDFWPASIKVSYTYHVPYSKNGYERPTMKHIGSDSETTEHFASTRETFQHHSISLEYKHYMSDFYEDEGGTYFRSIVGLSFSKVNREWSGFQDQFLVTNFDLFQIRQTSLNLGLAFGYELPISDSFLIYGDIGAMLPFIKLYSNSTEYRGFPEFTLGLQLGVKYKLFNT
ncbi:hypothetical protein [Fluviicola sp.]|uniref:hypothetical protein n=1 Tax=Fluviicola sp. TaxID=1917219 RepID=UPI0031DBFF50